MTTLENYFQPFRQNIVGIDTEFETPYGKKKMIYADWIASGRLYKPIEDKITNVFGPFVGNTHSEASETGQIMTQLYHRSHQIIKEHVNASANDVIITTGSGMTGAVNKFQRILGMKFPEHLKKYCVQDIPEEDVPVVFVTHMEHHSNHTSWLETIADVVVLEPNEKIELTIEALERALPEYKNRKIKIGAFSAGSNVTGIVPDYHKLAEIMHRHAGYAFVDFAASAPYIKIDMHPENPSQYLDAIMFSPHKALGGPGSTGVLIFNRNLYKNKTPDHPGGGTVAWTNRWNEYAYIQDIELREDGGTPAFLQTMRAALAFRLKEKMGVENIKKREDELQEIIFAGIDTMPTVHLLAGEQRDRLGVFSFFVEDIHYNLVVRLLNDRFGIQTRGGCSCAGTYGHFLLNVTFERSHEITSKIESGDLTDKPGWVRISIHPTMTDDDAHFIISALSQIIENAEVWSKDYIFDKEAGEFFHKDFPRKHAIDFDSMFDTEI